MNQPHQHGPNCNHGPAGQGGSSGHAHGGHGHGPQGSNQMNSK